MALTASRTMQFKLADNPKGDYVELPVAASTTIHSGGFVGMIGTGYVQPYVSSTVGTTLTGFDRLIGIALEEVDNSSGNAGDETVKILISGCFKHAVSGLAITDVGTPVFASDDGTLTKVSLGNQRVGTVERFEESGYGMIRLAPRVLDKMRWTPSIETVAANIALLVHPTENQSGLLVLDPFALVTEVFGGDSEDQGIITLQDTAGTTLGITFTALDAAADAVDDVIAPAGEIEGMATGVAVVVVPAGLGVQAKVTQLTSGASEAGAMKIGLRVSPIA